MIRESAALVILVATAAPAALAQSGAVRGLASSVEVEYGPRLRAKAEQSPTSPVMVRVSRHEGSDTQRIEFIGLVAGTFDLRDYVEREDGRGLDGLTAIPVTVASQLSADHGTDLYGTTERGFSWRTHYTELMWAAGAFWVAAPVVAILIRALRKRGAPAPAPQPLPSTLEDQLRGALDAVRDRSLTVEERGQLELLVFRFLADRSRPGAKSSESVAQAFHDIRAHPETRELVVAIEHWLHAKEGGETARADANAALGAFRRSRITAPTSQPAGVSQ